VEIDVDVDVLATLEGEVARGLKSSNLLGGRDLIRGGVAGSAAEAGTGTDLPGGAGHDGGNRHDGGGESGETHDG
jgi:hypothetical protein